ncbi:hypothetical protein L3X07_10075 [Levilactobacillus brevis]|nr:hypothetical protein [Levilactobacillus brevis]
MANANAAVSADHRTECRGALLGPFWLPKAGQYHRHATLLAILGMDLAHLYDARLRLEATGLLTTTVSTKDDLTSFNYDLNAPLLPAPFLKTTS